MDCSSINTAAVLCSWFEPLCIVCRFVTMVLWYSVTPPGYDHGGGDLKAGSRSGRWSWHPHSLVGCMAIPTILKYLCTSKDPFAWLPPAPLRVIPPRFFFDTFSYCFFYLCYEYVCTVYVRVDFVNMSLYIGFFELAHLQTARPISYIVCLHFT